MSGGLDLEQRYRRVLRLLPRYYRDTWEEDMVAAFLDSWLTGDPDEDEAIGEFCRPTWPEVASVAGLAARLYLGGAGAPPRYFAWGQAVRRAVLAVTLIHAVVSLDVFMRLAWERRSAGVPAPPAGMAPISPGGIMPPTGWYMADCAWIVVFVLLVLEHYRLARALAVLAILPDLVWLLQGQFTGALPATSFGPWAFWVLLNLAPVLAMAAFYRDAPPIARWPWLLALPAVYLLIYVPALVLQVTGNAAWLPDSSGLFCMLVALACLAHAPRARSRQFASSGAWSLALTLLAAVAGAYRVASFSDYLHDPHLIMVGLAELLILVAAVALVAPDAARAQAATPAPPRCPQLG
ncbi:MAG: hypothetical protein WAK82_39705 [Streptosporangiaceae bacterium]